jgi:hypothetical protein
MDSSGIASKLRLTKALYKIRTTTSNRTEVLNDFQNHGRSVE